MSDNDEPIDESSEWPARRGPRLVRTTFLFTSLLLLVLGIVSGLSLIAERHVYGLAILASTILLAASFAFFGYALDLLMEIADNTRPFFDSVDE